MAFKSLKLVEGVLVRCHSTICPDSDGKALILSDRVTGGRDRGDGWGLEGHLSDAEPCARRRASASTALST